eukprot:Nitzschia sp. Nitz4//scaffold292_size23309//17096//19147//NITZ4_008499-RA/size23309-processed-gene-0.13-mRNA-1//1//CDS//3329546176//6892//frame0
MDKMDTSSSNTSKESSMTITNQPLGSRSPFLDIGDPSSLVTMSTTNKSRSPTGDLGISDEKNINLSAATAAVSVSNESTSNSQSSITPTPQMFPLHETTPTPSMPFASFAPLQQAPSSTGSFRLRPRGLSLSAAPSPCESRGKKRSATCMHTTSSSFSGSRTLERGTSWPGGFSSFETAMQNMSIHSPKKSPFTTVKAPSTPRSSRSDTVVQSKNQEIKMPPMDRELSPTGMSQQRSMDSSQDSEGPTTFVKPRPPRHTGPSSTRLVPLDALGRSAPSTPSSSSSNVNNPHLTPPSSVSLLRPCSDEATMLATPTSMLADSTVYSPTMTPVRGDSPGSASVRSPYETPIPKLKLTPRRSGSRPSTWWDQSPRDAFDESTFMEEARLPVFIGGATTSIRSRRGTPVESAECGQIRVFQPTVTVYPPSPMRSEAISPSMVLDRNDKLTPERRDGTDCDSAPKEGGTTTRTPPQVDPVPRGRSLLAKPLSEPEPIVSRSIGVSPRGGYTDLPTMDVFPLDDEPFVLANPAVLVEEQVGGGPARQRQRRSYASMQALQHPSSTSLVSTLPSQNSLFGMNILDSTPSFAALPTGEITSRSTASVEGLLHSAGMPLSMEERAEEQGEGFFQSIGLDLEPWSTVGTTETTLQTPRTPTSLSPQTGLSSGNAELSLYQTGPTSTPPMECLG